MHQGTNVSNFAVFFLLSPQINTQYYAHNFVLMPFNWEGKFLLLQLIIYQERILFVAMVVIPLVARHKSSNLRLVFHWKHYYIAIHQSNLGMCMFCRWCSNYEWGNKYEPLDFGSSCRNGTLLKMLKGWH